MPVTPRCVVCGGDRAGGQRGCQCEDGGTWVKDMTSEERMDWVIQILRETDPHKVGEGGTQDSSCTPEKPLRSELAKVPGGAEGL